MKKLFLIPLFSMLVGCAHMHIVCPQSGSIVVAVGGSQIGNQVVSGIQSAAMAGLFARPMSTAPGASVDYDFLAVWGPDYARCDAIPPPQPVPIPLPVTMVPTK